MSKRGKTRKALSEYATVAEVLALGAAGALLIAGAIIGSLIVYPFSGRRRKAEKERLDKSISDKEFVEEMKALGVDLSKVRINPLKVVGRAGFPPRRILKTTVQGLKEKMAGMSEAEKFEAARTLYIRRWGKDEDKKAIREKASKTTVRSKRNVAKRQKSKEVKP